MNTRRTAIHLGIAIHTQIQTTQKNCKKCEIQVLTSDFSVSRIRKFPQFFLIFSRFSFCFLLVFLLAFPGFPLVVLKFVLCSRFPGLWFASFLWFTSFGFCGLDRWRVIGYLDWIESSQKTVIYQFSNKTDQARIHYGRVI